MPWYHTSEEVSSAFAELESSCPNVTFVRESKTQGSVSLEVLRLSRGDAGGSGKTKAMLVFGEHARELITVESGLELVKNICGAGADAARAADVLDKVDLTIVPNANPIGRKDVEQGSSCKRTNENGVDLNRNWGDDHRNEEDESRQDATNPGPFGFSEPETQILRDLVTAEKPDLFLSVHSGAYMLGRPFGYSAKRELPNEDDMDKMLSSISEKYCQGGCPIGSLSQTIGYKSKGCDMDYISEKVGTPYVFEWEIYADPGLRQYYYEEARQRATGQEMSGDAKSFFVSQGIGLLKVGQRLRGSAVGAKQAPKKTILLDQDRAPGKESEQKPKDCSKQFNPQDPMETKFVVENWAGAYLELMELVSARKAGGRAPTPTAKPSAQAVVKQEADDAAEDASSAESNKAKVNAWLSVVKPNLVDQDLLSRDASELQR